MTQPPVQQLPARAAPAPVEFVQTQALGQATSLRGAASLGATIEADPLLGYFYALLDDAGRKRVLEAIAEDAAKMFELMLKAGYDAMGLIRGDPEARLAFYKTKTVEMWEEQKLKYPSDFQEDQADLERLLEREAKGEIGVPPTILPVLAQPQPQAA